MIYCRCGAQCPDNTKFCPKCGTALSPTSTQANTMNTTQVSYQNGSYNTAQNPYSNGTYSNVQNANPNGAYNNAHDTYLNGMPVSKQGTTYKTKRTFNKCYIHLKLLYKKLVWV